MIFIQFKSSTRNTIRSNTGWMGPEANTLTLTGLNNQLAIKYAASTMIFS